MCYQMFEASAAHSHIISIYNKLLASTNVPWVTVGHLLYINPIEALSDKGRIIPCNLVLSTAVLEDRDTNNPNAAREQVESTMGAESLKPW